MVVSVQSNRIGWATVASVAGLSRLGVPGVPDGGGGGGGAAPARTVRLADRAVAPKEAVMVTGVFAVTADVVTVKLAELWPASTVAIGWG